MVEHKTYNISNLKLLIDTQKAKYKNKYETNYVPSPKVSKLQKRKEIKRIKHRQRYIMEYISFF